MTSAYAAESNRRNAAKSTGPREGKERSRWNALKHGATARLLVLPGEQAEELEQERDAWIASLDVDGPIERALAQRAFESWHQLGRTLRVQQARLEKQMHEAERVERQRELDAVLELGNRLFFDRHGPSQCYPNSRPDPKQPPTSGAETPGDPDHPLRLVLKLEGTADGCRLLLARWRELAAILEAGDCWRSPDRFRAIRLLGKQPIDATVNSEVLQIFLACHVLCPVSKSPLQDLVRELDERPGDPPTGLRPLLKQLPIERYTPKDAAEARQFLASLVDGAACRLQALLADHEAREGETASGPEDRHAFDFDHEGELLRRYETSSDRAFHRALERLRLLRKDAHTRERGTRKAAGETARVEGEDPATEPATETGAQSLRRPLLSTPGRPVAEAESSAPPPPEAGSTAPAPAQAGSGAPPPMAGPSAPPPPEAGSSAPPPGETDGRSRAEPRGGNGPNLRNEAVAASIDRGDSAGQADAHAPPGRPPNPPNRPHAHNTQPALLVPP